MSTLKVPKADGGVTSVQVGCAAFQVAARALYAAHSTKSSGRTFITMMKLLGRLHWLLLLLSNASNVQRA
jgi:hypothetical protein